MTLAPLRRNERVPSRAFSLVEVTVSIAIVGVMLVASLHTVGMAKRTQRIMGDQGRGQLLAQQLMSEILTQLYADAVTGFGSFGLEEGEAATGDRSLFDDVDDYDGWSASPPQHQDGTEISELRGWTRSVSVTWVNSLNLSQICGNDTGVKRITVTVRRGDQVVASLVALRTAAESRDTVPFERVDIFVL